jgi:hypothetical protein
MVSWTALGGVAGGLLGGLVGDPKNSKFDSDNEDEMNRVGSFIRASSREPLSALRHDSVGKH